MAIALVSTLHVDFIVATLCHADGVEPNYLLDGIGNRLAFDRGRYHEILKFIVDEYDFVFARLLLDIFQRITHRHVIEVVRDALRHSHICKSAQQ